MPDAKPTDASLCHRVPRIRLVALDLDGTTLNRKGEVSPAVQEAIRRAREGGVRVVVATGRPLVEAHHPWVEMGGEDPVIACGGALVADPSRQETLFSFPLAEGDVWGWVESLEGKGLDVIACTLNLQGEDLYLWGDCRHQATRDYLGRQETRIKRIVRREILPPVGRLAAFGPKKVVEEAAKTGSRIAWMSKSDPGIGILEVAHPQADKGAALACLAERWGIPGGEVLAVGDHFNDLGMFRFAGHSAAMGNAPPEVAARADLVAGTNEEDGVAGVFRHFQLG